MAIRKRTRASDGVVVYWIDYRTPDGTRVREKGGYSREAAKRLLQNRLAEAGPDRNRKSATPFRAFVKVYLDRHAAMRKRPEWYRWLTDTMTAEFGDTPLRNVTAFRVQGYINRLTKRDDQDQILNGTTLGHHRRAVHCVFARAVEWGYLSVNPVKAVKTPRATEPRERYLTPDEAERLIAACPRDGLNRKGRPTRGGEIRHLIGLMLNTALRPGEAVSLRWADIYLDQNPPHLLVSTSKSGRPRWVPLNVQAVEALEAMKARRVGERVFPGRAGDGERRGFKRAFRAICKRAGLTHGREARDGVVPHTLRHTAISWMLQAGASPYAVGKVAGHSAASMTERYGHLAGSHLADAVRVLDRPVGTPADTRRFSGKSDAL